MELWAIALGFIILLFFIEIVSRLESEWKVKWESLEGIIDQPRLNSRLHGDYVENNGGEQQQVNITPDFDPILNKLVAEQSSNQQQQMLQPIQRVQQILSAAPQPPTLMPSMPVHQPTAAAAPPPPAPILHEIERPPAPIPKTKLTASTKEEFADLMAQYADYSHMVI